MTVPVKNGIYAAGIRRYRCIIPRFIRRIHAEMSKQNCVIRSLCARIVSTFLDRIVNSLSCFIYLKKIIYEVTVLILEVFRR